jgi:hypothetical protein
VLLVAGVTIGRDLKEITSNFSKNLTSVTNETSSKTENSPKGDLTSVS